MSPRDEALDIEALLAPISADKPAGDDIRFAIFENKNIYDEIRKRRRDIETKTGFRAAANNRARRIARTASGIRETDEAIELQDKRQREREAGHDPGGLSLEEDLRSISNYAIGVLKTKSKDLQIAVWLLDAQVRLRGFAGAASGLMLVRRLIETYWESCYPLPDPEEDEPIG